jgi:hypothetical protein
VPFEHVGCALATLVVHVWPHDPQFCSSLVSSTHVLPHRVGLLAGQPVPQVGEPPEPVVHTGVAPEQVTPHAPQLPCWARLVSHPSPASAQLA